MIAAIAAGGLACMANAAMLDLEGVDKTVTDVSELVGYDGVTNSSETQAKLTFNFADGVVQTYGGLISGNIRLVKLGSKSKLALTAANTYTGGTQIGDTGTDGGVIIVGNARACGDPSVSVELKNFNTSANKVEGPWTALQFDVSGFANPISLPAGTASAAWAGNTYCNHSICVTNNTGIVIDSPISGGYFALLGTKEFSLSGATTISDVTFNGPITCTGMKIYSGGNIHFRGAVTNSQQDITGTAWALGPKLRFYTSQNNFNGRSFNGRRGYLYAEADNVFNGLNIVEFTSGDGRMYLQGYDVTIGRVRCASATSSATSDDQTVFGGSGALSVLRMKGTADTVSNLRFTGNLSLVWDPTDDCTFTASSNRTSTLTGPIIVRRGTFALDGGHKMQSVTDIEALSGTTFKVSASSSINAGVVLRAESGATIDIAADVTVKAFKAGDAYLPAADYAAGTHGGVTITGGGTLHVTDELGAEWKTTKGAYYPYVYPLYVADVTTGNVSIDAVTFEKVEAPRASASPVTYDEFIASPRTGTIVKRGGGTLTFDKDISTFTGPVQVEDGVAIGVCSNCFGLTTNAGKGPNQRVYVHSGASLVMDAVGNQPKNAEANAVYYEGDGYPGIGGAYVFRNGDTAKESSCWQLGVGSQAVGPARLLVDIPSGGTVCTTYAHDGMLANEFNFGGQDVLLCGREAGSTFGPNSATLRDIGNLVVSNMTLVMYGNRGGLIPKNRSDSTISFNGGSRWSWCNQGEFTEMTATVIVNDMEYASFASWLGNGKFLSSGINPWGANGNAKRLWYDGPMVLNDDFRLYNDYSPRVRGEYSWSYGCTFPNKVSGPKGFRQWYNGNGGLCGDAMRINLLNDNNTFEGGIVLAEASLGVYGEKAVPSHDGAGIVSITNGYVYFGRKLKSASVTNNWVNFTMPVTEFIGNCAVTNGTGFWQGLVKKGEGTLDYNSQLDGAYLDLQEGTVKFNTQYREKYSGDYAQYAPTGYDAALPVFTTLKGTTGTLDLEDVGGAYTVANVEGSPSVTNGNLTVTNTWTLAASALGENSSEISGTLTFGENAAVTVTGDIDSLQRPSGGFLIARASSISGMPSFHLAGWSLQKCGGELRLVKPGLSIILR